MFCTVSGFGGSDIAFAGRNEVSTISVKLINRQKAAKIIRFSVDIDRKYSFFNSFMVYNHSIKRL